MYCNRGWFRWASSIPTETDGVYVPLYAELVAVGEAVVIVGAAEGEPLGACECSRHLRTTLSALRACSTKFPRPENAASSQLRTLDVRARPVRAATGAACKQHRSHGKTEDAGSSAVNQQQRAGA